MDTFTDEQLRYRIALAAIKGMNRLLAETLIEATGDVSLSTKRYLQYKMCRFSSPCQTVS